MKNKFIVTSVFIITSIFLTSCGNNMTNTPNVPNVNITKQTCERFKEVVAKYEKDTTQDNGQLLNSPEYKQAKEFIKKNCK